jgi:hypothetical protein
MNRFLHRASFLRSRWLRRLVVIISLLGYWYYVAYMPPSARTIKHGIRAAIMLNRHVQTSGTATAPARCDRVCAGQFQIDILEIRPRASGMMAGFWADHGPYPYWDIRVMVTQNSGRSEMMTVRFWDVGSAEWEVGEPLIVPGMHLTVDWFGKQETGIE